MQSDDDGIQNERERAARFLRVLLRGPERVRGESQRDARRQQIRVGIYELHRDGQNTFQGERMSEELRNEKLL